MIILGRCVQSFPYIVLFLEKKNQPELNSKAAPVGFGAMRFRRTSMDYANTIPALFDPSQNNGLYETEDLLIVPIPIN